MFETTASWDNYFYGGLRNFIDAEAAYVDIRQQSTKANLPKVALSVVDSVSFAVKGVTVAAVLGYGAPLPVTALATLSLFPSNTFSYLATKINKFSDKFNKWFFSDDEQSNEDKHDLSVTTNSSYLDGISNWIPTLETTQYLITNGLTLYQNLLPINWVKIMAVEVVEQPLRWYYGGALPEYYTKNAISDWVWMLSGVTGEMVQSHRLLSNACYSKLQPLSNAITSSASSVTYLPTVIWANSYDVRKSVNLDGYLSVINTQHVVPILPFVITQMLGKSLLKENFNVISSNLIVLTGLSMLQGANAGSTTINLQTGVPINVLLDLTKLTGTSDISSVVIKYPQNFAQNGLKFIPQFVRNYTQGDIREAYEILTDNVDRITEKFSNGVQLDNEISLTSFLYSEGQLKWRYKTNGWAIENAPAVANDGTVYIGSRDDCLYAIYPNGVLKWKTQTGSGVGIFSPPSIGNDGVIYVGDSDQCMYAIQPNGNLKWRYQTGYRFIDSSLAIARDGTLYFGSWDSFLYALFPDGTLKWRYKTGDIVYSSPAIARDGTLYFGSGDSFLYALFPDGTLKWRYQADASVLSSPAIASEGIIYVSSEDKFLYAIYPNGSLKWRYQTGGGQSSPAIASEGTIYSGSVDQNLCAFYPNGTLKWKYKRGGSGDLGPSCAIGGDGTIYTGGCEDAYLYAIRPDGNLRWKYLTSNSIRRSHPVVSNDGTVYIGSVDSYLYSISSKTVLSTHPWPQFHQNILHTGMQATQQGLQLFDIRYLILEGTPIVNGLLQIDLAVNVNQVPSFDMNINILTSPQSDYLHSTIDLNNSLVAYYPFNGNANDESGNGNNGVVMGATLTLDMFGRPNKAYHFDGVSSYIKIPMSAVLHPVYDLSVSAWARRLCTNNCGDYQQIVTATAAGCSDKYILGWYRDTIMGYVPNTIHYCDVSVVSNAITDSNWHHLVLTYGSNGEFLYVDGLVRAAQPTGGPILGGTSNWIGIGADDDAQQGRQDCCYFNGDITEVRIYNRVLTTAEIMVLYQNNSTVVTPTPEAESFDTKETRSNSDKNGCDTNCIKGIAIGVGCGGAVLFGFAVAYYNRKKLCSSLTSLNRINSYPNASEEMRKENNVQPLPGCHTSSSVTVIPIQRREDDVSSSGSEKIPPNSFCCPITQELMQEPVILVETSQTYERTAILEWLKEHNTCPQTNQKVHSIQLIPNYALKKSIEEWKEKRNKQQSKKDILFSFRDRTSNPDISENYVTGASSSYKVGNSERQRSRANLCV